MHQVYQRDDVHGVLLADASNAFNCLNRSACIANIHKLCPELYPAIVNMYRNPAGLFVGGEEILSCEGTTQGDPLAMPWVLYHSSVKPQRPKSFNPGMQMIQQPMRVTG